MEPGAVTPFGAINDTEARVTVVLDAAMMEHDILNFHPLINVMTTAIRRDDLVKFLTIDRPRAPHRAGFRPGRNRLIRPSGRPDTIAFGGRMTHLNGWNSRLSRTKATKGEEKCCRTAG